MAKEVIAVSSTEREHLALPFPAIKDLFMMIDRRLAFAEQVAQHKWNAFKPIVDQEREENMLSSIPDKIAHTSKLRPEFVQRFFQAQFDASASIQKNHHAQWQEERLQHHARIPFALEHDLEKCIRPQLDALTNDLITALDKAMPLLEQKESREQIRKWVLDHGNRSEYLALFEQDTDVPRRD